jgi:hypothetical protein
MRPRTALILVVAALAGGSVDGRAQPRGTTTTPAPAKLWKSFPLGQRTSTRPVRAHAPKSAPRPAPPRQGGHAFIPAWLWVMGATTLMLCATAVVGAKRLTNSRRGGDMEKFRRRDRQADKLGEEHDPSVEQEQTRGADLVTSYLTTPQTPAPDPDSFERFGEHVSSVLTAAREAAARIEHEAREEAERIRGQAKAEAVSRVEAAREEVDATRAEAQLFRSESEEWAKQTRSEAETYAAEQRSEAQTKAKSIVVEAERHAVAMGEEAKRREQALKMDISLAEDRLRQLALGLHEVAARLDGLLGSPAQSHEGDESSLVEALAPSRETEDVTM